MISIISQIKGSIPGYEENHKCNASTL